MGKEETPYDGYQRVDSAGLGFTRPGSGGDDSARMARAYLDALQMELRVIDAVEADTHWELFGETFATPVMVAALSSLDRIKPQGLVEVARGAAAAGAVMWIGVGGEEELRAVTATGAKVVRVVKPFRDHALVLENIAQAEQYGALAVGMDVSFAFGMKNGYSPAALALKTQDDLKRCISATRLPFVVKGILSASDAEKALSAGAAALMVSTRGGTVSDGVVPPLKVLPEIVKVVNKRIPVFVDGGFARGLDVFKGLALGASAIGVGRAVLAGLAVGGAEGVSETLSRMTAELRRTMSLTGSADLFRIDPNIVWSD